MTERYKLGDIDNAQFYMIPKSLIDSDRYKGLSIPAKVVYALLIDRMHISRKNGWINQRGEIYLIFSQNKLATKLGKGKASINRYITELKEFGLLDMEYQKSATNGNMPALIFIKKLPRLTEQEAMELKEEVLLDTSTLSDVLQLNHIINTSDDPGPLVNHPGPYMDRPGPLMEHPGPYMEHPGSLMDHPGPQMEHPGPQVDPSYTNYSNTKYSNTEYNKTKKVIDIEDDDREPARQIVDNFSEPSADPSVIKKLISDYSNEIRDMSRGANDITPKQAEYVKTLIDRYSPEVFSRALTIASIHQNLKLAYIESVMQGILSNSKKAPQPTARKTQSRLMTSRNSTNDEMLAQCLEQTQQLFDASGYL